MICMSDCFFFVLVNIVVNYIFKLFIKRNRIYPSIYNVNRELKKKLDDHTMQSPSIMSEVSYTRNQGNLLNNIMTKQNKIPSFNASYKIN